MRALLPVMALLFALLSGCGGGSLDVATSGDTGGDEVLAARQAFTPTHPATTANESPGASSRPGADGEATPKATSTPTAPPPTATPVPKLCGEHIPKNTAARWRPGTDAYWDLRLLDLAPGYGGFFNNEYGSIIYVYMLDTSQKQVAKQAIEQLHPYLISENTEFRLLQGQYDMEQLHRWKSCIQDAENAGKMSFVSVNIRRSDNRVFICLFSESDQRLIGSDSRNIRKQLQEIGVPFEAVMLQEAVSCQPQTRLHSIMT